MADDVESVAKREKKRASAFYDPIEYPRQVH